MDETTTTKAKRILEVLREAREALLSRGWRPGVLPVNERGHVLEEDPLGRVGLVEAIQGESASVARWEARMLLQRIAGTASLPVWNGHPYRTGAEVVALIDTAIRQLGGIVPRGRYRERPEPRRGGWIVSDGPWVGGAA